MRIRLHIVAIFLPLFVVSSLCAQPPNPPPGWEYVRDLDSMIVEHYHSWNDTIFMSGRDVHSGVYRNFFLVSYTGGKDWDSAAYPRINPSGGYSWGFYPNDGRYWVLYQDSVIRFYTSRDGKTFDSILIGKDTTSGMGGISGIYIDPHDANHIIFKGSFSVAISSLDELFQSFDGGRSWEPVNVPLIPNERIYLDVAYNVRRSENWYVHVTEKAHHTEPEKDTTYTVRTTDNGQTFEGGQPWATYYGIRDIHDLTYWKNETDYTISGLRKVNDSTNDSSSINLLSLFHPSFQTTNYNLGYWRTLSQNGGQEPYFPTNFNFLSSDPLNSTLVEYELKWTVSTNIPIEYRTWVYQTFDDWKTWEIIWNNIEKYWVDQTFLDQKTNTLFATVNAYDSTGVTSHPQYFKSFLYKQILKKSSVNSNRNLKRSILSIFPCPAQQLINVQLPEDDADVISHSLSDVTGRTLLGIKDFYLSQNILELVVPETVLDGIYILKIRTKHSVYTVKVVLKR